MPKSAFTSQYDYFRALLVEAREKKGFTQGDVAAKLGKPQSFVSKYERGERRLDVVEFLEIAKALNIDSARLLKKLKGKNE